MSNEPNGTGAIARDLLAWPDQQGFGRLNNMAALVKTLTEEELKAFRPIIRLHLAGIEFLLADEYIPFPEGARGDW
jgi:hypothetical protein